MKFNSYCLNPLLFVTCLTIVWSNQAAEYVGEVSAFGGDMGDVTIILESRDTLETTTPDRNGRFQFENLKAATSYFVKVQVPGHRTTPARKITLPLNDQQLVDGVDRRQYEIQRILGGAFEFHWEEDQSTAGFEYSSSINNPVQIEFLNEDITVADTSDSGNLLSEYNIALVDDEEKWSSEHSYRLHQTISTILPALEYSIKRKPAEFRDRWTLTMDEVADDIEITVYDDGSKDVRISNQAFTNASPKIVEIDGRRGIWYSQRLHHAVVRYATDNGYERSTVGQILENRFGVGLEPNYMHITQSTTDETESSFQEFKPAEFISLINMMEEMPRGFHKIPQLRYLVRRVDGMDHPLYPEAPAVAWPGSGYIEFMESGFTQNSAHYIHRLILHEKAHFLWEWVLDSQTREDWIELGQWYVDNNSESGWSTHLTTQFVSAYAHLKNPNEDMAESIADFVVNPDVLTARAPSKYEFIRNRIMAGNVYLSKIREDLTFQVYNLYPDYVYPGKIKRVDVEVLGDSKDDKNVTIEVELHALDYKNEGANYARFRLVSDIGTIEDMFIYPIDKDGNDIENGVVLRGSKTLSKYFKAGYWYPVQLVTSDSAGNLRFQRNNTFEMKIYVDNFLEDYIEPKYVSESIQFTKRDAKYEQAGIEHDVQILTLMWDYDENVGLRDNDPCYTRIAIGTSNKGSLDEYGPSFEGRCKVEYVMPHYMSSGTYDLKQLRMIDKGKNVGKVQFLSDGPEDIPQIQLITRNPDETPPELDVNRISVSATPTNPDEPNGETNVHIKYGIRDDNSGIADTRLYLRDPQGGIHFRWHQSPDRDAVFTHVKPNVWQNLELNWILPEGSPPGRWGLFGITVQDKAANVKRYDFTEIIHIDVENHSARVDMELAYGMSVTDLTDCPLGGYSFKNNNRCISDQIEFDEIKNAQIR